jgi:nocturnin
MTWNILADGLAQGGNFAHVEEPDTALAWERRGPQILAIVRALDPDVLCMQELNHWKDTFEPVLCFGGPFAGVYTPTNGDVAARLCGDADGEGLLYRRDRLTLVASRVVRFDPRHNQRGIIAVLREVRDPSVVWVVSTCHLKAKGDPTSREMRLVQAGKMLAEIKDTLSMLPPTAVPVLCGDMNEAPPKGAGERCVYDLISSKSEFRSAYAAVSAVGATEAMETGISTLKYRSAEVGEASSAPTVSKRIIDYIWCDHRRGTVQNVLALPTEDEIGPKGLPTATFPSDHVPLVADIAPLKDAGAATPIEEESAP